MNKDEVNGSHPSSKGSIVNETDPQQKKKNNEGTKGLVPMIIMTGKKKKMKMRDNTNGVHEVEGIIPPPNPISELFTPFLLQIN